MKQSLLKKLWLRTSMLVAVILCGAGTAWGQDDVVKIGTVDELKAFRDAVNSGNQYAGKTVKLTADLDLSSESNWKPIGNVVAYPGQSFNGIFDGDGHTISNVTSSDNTPEQAVAGLFGSIVNGTIKNLTVKNVNITSTHYAAGIVGYTSNGPTIENCKVIGGSIISTPELVGSKYDGGNKVGGIMGLAQKDSKITGCLVEGLNIKGYREVGGIVGYSAGTVSNNIVKNVIVEQDLSHDYKTPTPTTVKDIVGDGSAASNPEASGNTVIKSDPVAQIGETKYETLAEASAAANTGDVIEIIKAGDYKLPNLPNNVTIEGTVEGVNIDANVAYDSSIASVPNGATFKDLTFNWNDVHYHGFQHAGTINMENCKHNGRFFSYGNMNFTNCEFEYNGDEYCMWVYGSGEVVYDNCTFTNNTKGKLLHLYCEDKDLTHKVTVKDCKFHNNGSLSKSAINVKSTCKDNGNVLQYELYLEGNNTVDGNFPTAVGEQDNSDHTWILSPLAQVDDRKVNPDNITVYENDKLIYPNYVAAIGDTKYTTLQGAFDAAETDQTVTLLKDYDATGEYPFTAPNGNKARNLGILKSITFDGANHTLTVKGNGIWVGGGSSIADVKIKDVTITNAQNGGRCVDTRGSLNSLTLDKAILSTTGTGATQPLTIGGDQADAATVMILNGSTVATSEDGKYGYAITTFNPVNMTIDGSTIKGWACLNIKAASSSAGSNGSVFTITNSELTSKNVYPGESNAYSVFKIEDVDVTVNVTNTTINVDGDSNTEAIVAFAPNNTNGSIVNLGEGNNVTFTGTTDFALNDNAASKLVISGGTFNQPVPEQNCAEGMIPSDLGDGKYSVKVGSYAAKINEKKYETLEAAFAAAADGATITLLANSEGNGIIAPEGKFNTTGLTVNFNNFTYTITGPGLAGSTGTKTQAFQLLKDNKITFENGAIVGNNADVKMMIQNYSDLTLDNMVLDATQGTNNIGYVLSTNNGNTVIKDTKITAKEGGSAFDACTGWGGYKSNNVELTGSSEITGPIEVSFYGEGTAPVLKLTSGTHTGEIVMADGAEKATVTKNNDFVQKAPADYMWFDNGDGTSTLVPYDPVSTPTIFHDEEGTYEGSLDVAIAGEGTIMYKLNDGEATAYTAPITINATTKVTAWAEKDGVKSDEVTKTFTIVEKQAGAEVADGYYNIKTNDGKYVNVAGRKTVTLASDAKSAGTVIRVSADANGVKVLRSQGVDVPGYAKKAMNYVPEIVQLAVDKLHAEGSGKILGEHGLDAIMEEFNKSFDYNLYLEKSGDAYRIYGRTPSMKPVVDFYAKNKANVDAKLPQLEAFINSAIDKVLDKTGGRGASILVDFKLHDVWQNMPGKLTEPTDEASTLKFYEEVLSSETNVWNFAYQTAMIYWGNLKNHPRFAEIKDKLGDYSKYIDKVENIRPNFKYYIVPSGSGVDFISEGNEAIKGNNASAAWTMAPVTTFQIEIPNEKTVTVYPTSGGTQKTYKEYYTTLYTDFAYTLPVGVKAFKVTAITDQGVAKREEITGTIPAQTPVLLVGESNTATLTLSTEAGTAITDNLLVGPDALINEYQIKTPQVVSLFDFANELLGESAYKTYVEKYEHLMLKNAGTVNNKYFFGIGVEDDTDNKIYGASTQLRMLNTGDANVAFYLPQDVVKANQAFLMSETKPVKLFLVGDVNRDGAVSIADVTALVNIILGKAKYPEDNDKYDFEAANVNGDKTISIADVTALVNIILGK